MFSCRTDHYLKERGTERTLGANSAVVMTKQSRLEGMREPWKAKPQPGAW